MKEVVGEKKKRSCCIFHFSLGLSRIHPLAYLQQKGSIFSYDLVDGKCYLYTRWQNSIIVNKWNASLDL